MRIFFLIIFAIGCLMESSLFADKVSLNDGTVLKGVVVENFVDRINLSTFEGEKMLLKKDIAKLRYSSVEDNLLNMANGYRDRGNLYKAYFNYSRAYELNPESKEIKDGLTFTSQKIFKDEQRERESTIIKNANLANFKRDRLVRKGAMKDYMNMLSRHLGLTIKVDKVYPIVANVESSSPSADAGLLQGDKIVAIWSRLTGYLNIEDVISRLLDPMAEKKITIERDVKVRKTMMSKQRQRSKDFGAKFVVKWEGVTIDEVMRNSIAEGAGLIAGDLIREVNGKSTRYMKLKEFNKIINKNAGKANLKIHREVTLWGF